MTRKPEIKSVSGVISCTDGSRAAAGRRGGGKGRGGGEKVETPGLGAREVHPLRGMYLLYCREDCVGRVTRRVKPLPELLVRPS